MQEKIGDLKKKYRGFIESFDLTKRNIIEVVYITYDFGPDFVPSINNPNWEFVKNEVEGIIPVKYEFQL